VAARAQRKKPARARRVKRPSPPAASTPWPRLEAFFESGEASITLGCIDRIDSLRYTAVASDDYNMYVALVRNEGESLLQLLNRLEAALGHALDEDRYIDEFNGPSDPLPSDPCAQSKSRRS
jgi:hypothetical protein